MSFETALAKRLLDSAPAKAKVGTRIDWDRRWGRELPAYTLSTSGDPRPQHMKGFQRVRPTRVVVECWGATKADAIALRDIAIAVLTPAAKVSEIQFQRAQVPLVRSVFDGTGTASDGQPQGETYREIIDFIFTHNG
jgi:hypothetical protein